jgi:hypothetical protein
MQRLFICCTVAIGLGLLAGTFTPTSVSAHYYGYHRYHHQRGAAPRVSASRREKPGWFAPPGLLLIPAASAAKRSSPTLAPWH